jgi:hypothetical protein
VVEDEERAIVRLQLLERFVQLLAVIEAAG